jgi:hypothetical protein
VARLAIQGETHTRAEPGRLPNHGPCRWLVSPAIARARISVITSGTVTNELLSRGDVLVNGDAGVPRRLRLLEMLLQTLPIPPKHDDAGSEFH